MSEETKTPKPGEWWISDDGSIIRIVGTKLNGGVIYENQAGFSFQFNSMTNWRHEPRCTGFDWVEPQAETWPKWYVGKNWSDGDAYVRVDDTEAEFIWVSADGSERVFKGNRYASIPLCVSEHSWREVTEAEALARVEPEPEPEQAEWYDMAAIQNMDLRRSEMASGGRISWAENQAIGQVIAIAKRAIQPVEKWPKYYVGKNWSDADAYVRFDNATDQCVLVSAYGSTETHDETYAYVPDAIRRHSWREITEAEALGRVKPESDPPPFSKPFTNPRSGMGIRKEPVETLQQLCEFCTQPLTDDGRCLFSPCVACDIQADIEPVESPDDWVEITDHGHVVRSYIDQVLVSAYGGHSWVYAVISGGSCLGDLGIRKCRCRRRDLPVQKLCTCPTLDGIPVTGSACPIHGLPSCELQPAAKRIPVRLWINGDDGVVFQSEVHVNAGDQEIKHDADGFYVEGGERWQKHSTMSQ